MDIQKYTRMIKFDDILDDLMDLCEDNEDMKDLIYDYFAELKTK